MFIRKLFFVCPIFAFSTASHAQIEVDYLKLKEFKTIGFGSFLNFSIPVSEANYVTTELGVQYFKDKNYQEVALIPVLAGYRYTLNKSGTGLYVEPNAGYCFGESTVELNDERGSTGDGYANVKGPIGGMNIGYLFEFSGRVQFNLALKYEHTFSQAPTDLFAFRISHAITFRRRDYSY
jgi:hypothetical protein